MPVIALVTVSVPPLSIVSLAVAPVTAAYIPVSAAYTDELARSQY
jgi:hypothetical protein